jgi:hypothetical protein
MMQYSLKKHLSFSLVLLSFLGVDAAGYAQEAGTAPEAPGTGRAPEYRIGGLLTVGSPAEDRLRLDQLLGRAGADGFLIRSPSSLTPPTGGEAGGFHWHILVPEARSVWNSAIPYSLNEGSMWAGQGLNVQVMAGLHARFGPLSLTLAPQFSRSANEYFEAIPLGLQDRVPDRSLFASLWYLPPRGTIDLPFRFGERPYAAWDLGQSSLVLDGRWVAAGVGTENQWWGPGIRNAIVMSNNAPGFPHAFVRTGRPLRTPLGNFEAKWLIGGLSESVFFAGPEEEELRSLSGFAFTYRPALDPRLTVGASRVVQVNTESPSRALGNAFDVARVWERRPHAGDDAWVPETGQIFSLFGRWLFPESGFEAYGEWARHELPVSLRDLLTTPQHTQGYTVGLQWARPVGPGVLRVQAEATSLEQSTTSLRRPHDTFYTSQAVPQGYTHRGQVIGAAIGPGSSGQWLALDLVADRWQTGITAGRVRWETDGLYHTRSPNRWLLQRSFHAYDASLLGGLRGGYRFAQLEVGAEFTSALRYNFLFQNPDLGWGSEGAVDVRNHTLRLFVAPRVRRR